LPNGTSALHPDPKAEVSQALTTVAVMDRRDAEQLLHEHARARDTVLSQITAQARETGQALWQIGSFAAGAADAWSDLDLVISGGPYSVGDAALVLDNPANGPTGGGYTGAAYLTGPLLVWVDAYAWPADLPVPVEAKLLAGQGYRGDLPLFAALDQHGRGPAPTQWDPDTFALAMIPIAAKYVARGKPDQAAGMVAMLAGDAGNDSIADLRALLQATDGPGPLIERVARMIDIAETLRR
jgi:hypothetical protein